jgi:hypothetical protein
MKRIVLVVLLIGALVLARVFALKHARHRAPKTQPAPTVPTPNPAAPSTSPPAPGTDLIEFKSDSADAQLLRVNEGVAGAGNVLIATRTVGSARWVVILAAGMDRYYSLDQDIGPDNMDGLQAAGFKEPPPPISQSMSIFRSLTKTEMNYLGEKGDRIIVLLCPKDTWQKLQLHWPQ